MAGDDASEEKQRRYKGHSQVRSLLRDVIDAASTFAASRNAPPEDMILMPKMALRSYGELVGSVTQWNTGVEEQLNFWPHNDPALSHIQKHGKPYMARESIEGYASDYLKLPYRAPMLERLLVDMLIALELYAFADEMLRPHARWFPMGSPLQQRHALLSYVFALFWSTMADFWRNSCVGAQLPSPCGRTIGRRNRTLAPRITGSALNDPSSLLLEVSI